MKKFFGDKKFYKMLLVILLPILLQQFITQFVNMIDNIMVGRVGNDEMIGVSLANQLLFVLMLGIFGAMSGASIFGSQFFGAQDKEGYQESFRFKWLIGLILIAIGCAILFPLSDELIGAFIKGVEGEYSNGERVLEVGKEYLYIMIIGFLPFLIKEIYASSLREQRETLFPMICGVVAIFTNLVLDWAMIFGHLGFKEMGVIGAAWATVIARVVEMLMIVLYTHFRIRKYVFLQGVYKKLYVSFKNIRKFLAKTFPLMGNEILWSIGMTMVVNCLSIRGLDVIGAINIRNTVTNVFIVTGNSVGAASGIILGNLIGAGKSEEAHATSYKLISSAILISLVLTLFEFLLSYVIPEIFNTSEEIIASAERLIRASSILLPIFVFNTTCYFILRCGGKMLLTFGFDAMYIWAVRIPIAFILAKYTNIDIVLLCLCVEGADILKTFVGYILVDKGIWLKKLV